MKRIIIAFALTTFFIASYAQDTASAVSAVASNGEWIDKKFEKCLKSSDAVSCGWEALNSWDEVVEGNYTAVISAMSEPDKSAMIADQASWNKFKDAHFKQVDKLDASYFGKETILDEKIDFLTQRALFLFALHDLLK